MPRLSPPGRIFGNCQPVHWRYHEVPLSSGATCLDGSPYGFYFMDGLPNKREPKTMRFNESWVLYLEGGGWCSSPEDCALRAETKSGSSVGWPRNGTISIGGLVNRCCFCTRFCKFRRVFLKSCDGHSFAGDATIDVPPRADAPDAPPTRLRSAGLRILSGVLDELLLHYGLAAAKSILVAGCSAGGMSALLNAERIRAELRTRGVHPDRFKVASLAGIFFSTNSSVAATRRRVVSSNGDTSTGEHEYAVTATGRTSDRVSPFWKQMRAAVQLGKMAIPARCSDTMPPGEAWRCLMGLSLVEALPEDLPAFVYQSRLDLWQTNCVLAAGDSRYSEFNCSSSKAWRNCLGWMQPLRSSNNKCSAGQWATLRAYEEANHAALVNSPALRRVGYGSFVHSCYDHCPSPYALINTGALAQPGAYNDSVSMRSALFDWFLLEQPSRVPAWNHTHHGCWNGLVANKLGKQQAEWCRKPECGQPDKMHHAETRAIENVIRKRGWRWQL